MTQAPEHRRSYVISHGEALEAVINDEQRPVPPSQTKPKVSPISIRTGVVA